MIMMRRESRILRKRVQLMGVLRRAASAVLLNLIISTAAYAAAFNYAGSTSPLTFDPHSTNDFVTASLVRQVYDTVVGLGPDMQLQPGIAIEWKYLGGNRWRFVLRRGATFHDGTPVTATDVAFSIKRQATSPLYSAMFGGIKETTVVDPGTVDVVSSGPDPILPVKMTRLFVMSKTWSEQHNLAKVPNLGAQGSEAYSLRHENGSGPMVLVSQEPNVKTEFRRNDKWWGTSHGNVTQATYRVIASGPTRLAALLSGELDLITDMPLQDVDRVKSNPAFHVETGPQRLFMELEMDGSRTQALDTTDKNGQSMAQNPFRNVLVRRAIALGIDDPMLVKKIMRGNAYVIGTATAQGFSGYQKSLDVHWPYDPAQARALLAQAGYPNGFRTTLNCPLERYVNAEETCQAIANMLARIGIDVKVNGMPWPKFARMLVNGPSSSFHLIGAAGNSGDAQDTFVTVMATRDPKRGRGLQNWALWSNPEFDAVTDELVNTFDPAQRTALYQKGLAIGKDQVHAVYLYQPALAWAMKRSVEIPVRADSTVVLENVQLH